MITASGCFGSPQPSNDTIDNVEEISSTVDGIIENIDENAGSDADTAASLLATHYLYMDKRIRLLTYAVVALAAVVIVKEL